jgi:hypothetical protein
MKMQNKFYAENLKKRDHLEDMSTNGEDNNKIDLKEEGMDWIHLSQYRVL